MIRGVLGRLVRERRGRYERVLRTSEEIDRLITERIALGERLRPSFFDGPGSEGDTVAEAALLAAADADGVVDPTRLAAIVVAAAFDAPSDSKSALLEISDATNRRD